jgi:hypothetical protein
MRQKTGLLTVLRPEVVRGLTVGVCVVALAFLLAMPAVVGAAGIDRANPGANAIQAPRVMPAPRLSPAPRVTPTPRLAPNNVPSPRFGPGPGIVRPNTYGPNCRSSCGSRCQMISCSGLNTSQCLSVRQRCRMSCSSRC